MGLVQGNVSVSVKSSKLVTLNAFMWARYGSLSKNKAGNAAFSVNIIRTCNRNIKTNNSHKVPKNPFSGHQPFETILPEEAECSHARRNLTLLI